MRYIPPEGDPKSKICLLGEAGGAHEERRGRPFVGPAGGVLEDCLHAAGIIRSECYITNVFKFRIYKDASKNIRHPETDEILWHNSRGFTEAAEEYLQELYDELNEIKANVIVPLGNPALEAITSKKGISKWRGSVLDVNLKHTQKAVPCIHPSATLQSGDYLVRYYMVFDLRRAKEEAEFREIRRRQRHSIINPSFEEVIANLDLIYTEAVTKQLPVNFDIEVTNQEIFCISFSISPNWAISVPIQYKWTADEEAEIWRWINKILSCEEISKCNQNILFDAWVLAVKNHILVKGRLDDPMVANHLIYPDFPKSLEFLTSIHTDHPYYKDDGKVWLKGLSKDDEQFYIYSCLDSMISLECMEKLNRELDEKGYRELYEFTLQLYRPLLYMMYHGMKVNREKLAEARSQIEEKMNKAQAELNEIAGGELNVNSFKQVSKYFYGVQEPDGTWTGGKVQQPYRNSKGRITTDDKAMARLAKATSTREGFREAKLIQEIRAYRKLLGTYMDIELDRDSRFRCSYNPRGTTTGRLSSSRTLFGTGTNMQNLPPEFKQFLVADDGFLLIELDKSQAEWVVVAYAGGDANMIKVIEEGLDPHSWTGRLITGIEDLALIKKEAKLLGHESNPLIINELRKKHFPELIDFEHRGGYIPRMFSIRQCGKHSNHGLNYGMGYRKFALQYEIPETEAKTIVDKYHQAYPGIRQGYHAHIQYQLRKNRIVVNCFGRKRHFFGRWGHDLFNQAYDFVAQSTVADLINHGLIKIYYDRDPCMRPLELLAQVHDSILFQFPVKDFELMAKAILRCVEHLDPEMEYHGRKFRIGTEMKVGLNWRDMQEVEIGKEVDGLARRLSEIYKEL
jgi:uracil-DNA glycosylase family 4